MRGAFADTQVARGAMCLKMFLTDRSRRCYRRLTFITFHSGCRSRYILGLCHYFGSCGGSCQPASKKRRLEASVTCFSVLRGVV